MKIQTARRMRKVAPSAVREILKVAERPDVLSFAGGLPAPELFPARELSQAFETVLRRNPGAALQYGITEGFHNKMETINRVAYGFRNFENYRLRVKVLCS